MAVEHSGRLELTCTNKHLRLLCDEDGGYTWVPPADYRVLGVRRLHDLESAALPWASHASARSGVTWRYLLVVRESDIAATRGSWAALRKLGGA